MAEPVITVVPVPKDDSQVAPQVPVPVVQFGHADDEIIAAAREHGLVVMTPAKLRAVHVLGSAFKKVGVIKMGRTMLAKAGEAASTGLDECQRILDSSDDLDLKAAVLGSKTTFTKELKEIANSFIRSAELDGNDNDDSKPRVRPFGAGQPAGPVQVIAQQAVVTTNNTTEK
jgi:hypothetical protein